MATCPLIPADRFVLFLLFAVILSSEPKQNQGRVLVYRKLDQAPHPVILLLAVLRQLFFFGSLVILDAVCCYFLFFLLYINIKQVKIDVKR